MSPEIRKDRGSREAPESAAGSARSGRSRVPAVVVSLAIGLVAAFVWLGQAAAETSRADTAKSKASSAHSRLAKGETIDDLSRQRTSDSRKALEALADDPDDRLALQAMAGLARDSGTKKAQDVAADAKRTTFVRQGALAVWLHGAKKSGASRSEVESAASTACGKDTTLAAQAAALLKNLWPSKSSTDGK